MRPNEATDRPIELWRSGKRGTVLQLNVGDKLNISLENALEQYRTVPCQ